MGQGRQSPISENPQTEAEIILKAQKDAHFQNPSLPFKNDSTTSLNLKIC